MLIEIDEGSGFCFGVTTAIKKAEEELAKSESLYCLGDIVHNGREVERLKKMGLMTVGHAELDTLHDTKMMLRAHGEPPQTYTKAKEQNITLIDATCPVVLNLQRRIRKAYEEGGQIVIYGKNGHAEVLGLVGQTKGEAIVLQHPDDVTRLDFSKDIYLYSQTTKSLEEFWKIINYIQEHISPNAVFEYYDTICRQVANRMPHLQEFAKSHELIFFVSGQKSSNGRILYHECQKVNPNTHFVSRPEDIEKSLLKDIQSVCVCGATSTPKWLMEACRKRILYLSEDEAKHNP